MGHHLVTAFAEQLHFQHGRTPSQTQNHRVGNQILLCRAGQEIDIEVLGHRHFHATQLAKNSRIHGRIRQPHHGGAGQGAARTNSGRPERTAHPGTSFSHRFDPQAFLRRRRQSLVDHVLYFICIQHMTRHLTLDTGRIRKPVQQSQQQS